MLKCCPCPFLPVYHRERGLLHDNSVSRRAEPETLPKPIGPIAAGTGWQCAHRHCAELASGRSSAAYASPVQCRTVGRHEPGDSRRVGSAWTVARGLPRRWPHRERRVEVPGAVALSAAGKHTARRRPGDSRALGVWPTRGVDHAISSAGAALLEATPNTRWRSDHAYVVLRRGTTEETLFDFTIWIEKQSDVSLASVFRTGREAFLT